MTQVVTRFAPSPTGFLHIGGARTAMFNWLYAKRFGGRFLLRIEDTDRERSTRAAVDAIIDGLAWLGLKWDGEAISQFERAERHREVAERLLASGGAYRCYASQEELEAMRAQARLEGKPMRYDGRWRDRDPSEAPPGVKPVIRLRARQDGETIVEDKVQGKVTFANKDLDDLVLLRSNGDPTYMLAVVVDDHDMGVTHIIRGDDHLTNAARQMQIYAALGWDVPVMAHIPLIHGPDGAKLSKRHGALGVEAYREKGYLPAALRNYLVRLGWSQGDREFFSTEELIAAFDLSAIGRSPSRFDFAKLENMNGHYMRAMPDAELLAALIKDMRYLQGGSDMEKMLEEKAVYDSLAAAIPGLKQRAKTLLELLDGARSLLMPQDMTTEASAIISKGGNIYLTELTPLLQNDSREWNATSNTEVISNYATVHGMKLGQIAQPLRAALTGRLTSPGIFDVMDVVGKEETLRRLAAHALPQVFRSLGSDATDKLERHIEESTKPNNLEEDQAVRERINAALSQQGSHEYITPSGATLTLLTELAREGKLAAMSQAYNALKVKYPENAQYVASSVPAKLTNGYFIKFLNLDVLRVVQWEQKNPSWAQQSITALDNSETFASEIAQMARRIADNIQ
jgi:glutamyl-tRNA synthetase